MQEDFELAASSSKNILLRSITRQIAQTISENKTNIYLYGREGVGKSICMNTIIACVRKDPKYICLFLPNGDKITQHYSYIEPSRMKEGFFDLPVLSQEACEQVLKGHGDQLEGLEVHSEAQKDLLKECFTEEQLQTLNYFSQEKITLHQIAQDGSENAEYGAQAYNYLTKYLSHHQTKYKFLIAVDEYNMYHWRSLYYHEEYDDDVRYPIPFYRVNLLEPFLNPMKHDTKDENVIIFTAISNSRPVGKERTRKLTETTAATRQNVTTLEVPRYSKEEHEAMVAHFESVGIGKLRGDKGKLLNDEHEMKYLFMVSGGIGKHLLNACII